MTMVKRSSVDTAMRGALLWHVTGMTRQAASRSYKLEAEGILTSIGLSTILDQQRQQYLLLQRNLPSLSQLVTNAEDDQKAFDKYLAHTFVTSSARREFLSKMEVAVGEPGSVTRNAQIDRLALIEDIPSPPI
jgi:hypothetical protein